MKVILSGALAQDAPRREFQLPLQGSATREDLLARLAGQIPSIARYMEASAETGKPVSLMIVANGNWIHPGDSIDADAEVEICPPISGG